MQYSIKDFFNNKEYGAKNIKDVEQNENSVDIKQEDDEVAQQPKMDNMEYTRDQEIELMRQSYSEINTFLYPFVVEVLDEFEFVGSPIYSPTGIDRETISQMVDRVINLAEESLDQVGEAKNERTGNYLREWDRWGLLRSTVESLLLNDIFAIRRPNHYRDHNSKMLE
ncbi:MAG: hypothetical protein ACLUCH_08510 [Lachnospirales bacterium]